MKEIKKIIGISGMLVRNKYFFFSYDVFIKEGMFQGGTIYDELTVMTNKLTDRQIGFVCQLQK